MKKAELNSPTLSTINGKSNKIYSHIKLFLTDFFVVIYFISQLALFFYFLLKLICNE